MNRDSQISHVHFASSREVLFLEANWAKDKIPYDDIQISDPMDVPFLPGEVDDDEFDFDNIDLVLNSQIGTNGINGGGLNGAGGAGVNNPILMNLNTMRRNYDYRNTFGVPKYFSKMMRGPIWKDLELRELLNGDIGLPKDVGRSYSFREDLPTMKAAQSGDFSDNISSAGPTDIGLFRATDTQMATHRFDDTILEFPLANGSDSSDQESIAGLELPNRVDNLEDPYVAEAPDVIQLGWDANPDSPALSHSRGPPRIDMNPNTPMTQPELYRRRVSSLNEDSPRAPPMAPIRRTREVSRRFERLSSLGDVNETISNMDYQTPSMRLRGVR